MGAISLAACMVTFESAHVLRRSLDALRATATGSGVEVSLTVVDNASTDGSAEAAEEAWPGARVLRNPRNRGYGPAINQAAAGTDADWLLFVNPDTLAGPGLLPMLPHVHPLEEIGAFTPLLTDAAGRPGPTAYRWPSLGKELARLAGAVAAAGAAGRAAGGLPGERVSFPEPVGEAVRVDYPVGACLFVRGDAWRRVGPFDEGFVLYHEEMEWCWRAARAGVRAYALPRVRAVHLGKASSRRRPPEAILWQYRGLLRFYELHRSRAERAALRTAMAASFAARAAGAGLTGRRTARALWEVSRLGVRGIPRGDRAPTAGAPDPEGPKGPRVSARPRVSVILPVRDEAARIRGSLDAILASDYPPSRLEVLVVDGMSRDGTTEAVSSHAGGDRRVRLIDNPGRTPAAGMNRGLSEARGEVIVRMDARADPEPGYIGACVDLLESSGAAAVGGAQRAVGTGTIGRAAAVATTTPFGVGDARFRYSEREQDVDTVYLGAWRASTLRDAGGFDERFAVNEDYELNHRLRGAGGRILLSPRIRSTYRIRDRLGDLARQYYRYGRGKSGMLRRFPGALRWRQLAPPLLVAGLAGSLAVLPVAPLAAAVVPGTYAVANLLASLAAGLRRDAGALPALPVVFATIHLSWGLGFWAGLLRGIA